MKAGVGDSVGAMVAEVGMLVAVAGITLEVKIGAVVEATVGRVCPVIPNSPRQAPVARITIKNGINILRRAGIGEVEESLYFVTDHTQKVLAPINAFLILHTFG